jgi:UDP-N-acetylmuramate: L-alanyl-gamma-D-glutamyl-meso-diaminopimelate ligase
LLRGPGGAPFVLEGDEYDTAFFEKTAKFLHYGAEVVVLTSIEHDHIDIYPSLDDYRRPFRELLAGLPATGHVIACASDPEVVAAVRDAASVPVTWYSLEGEDRHGEPAQWVAAPSASDASGATFDLFVGGVAAGRWSTPLMGRHNLANALGAMAACVHGFGVSPPDLRAPLASLAGVRRRQDLIGSPDGVLVYDDFAHHPTAVRETLLAFRSRHPRARLFAVFEPRSATACRRLHQDVYPESFAVADELLMAPVARALPADERLDVERVVRDVSQRGVSAAAYEDADAIVRSLVARARPGDVVAILSNGTFGQLHQKLLAALNQRARVGSGGTDPDGDQAG